MHALIFKIKINPAFGGFAQASNFITKMSNNIQLTFDEVKGIESILVKDIVSIDFKQLSTAVIKYFGNFRPITKPENLNRINTAYHIVYCLWIDKDSLLDTIDWQYDCLIKNIFHRRKYFQFLQEIENCII